MDPIATDSSPPLPHGLEQQILDGNAVALFGSQASWMLLAFMLTQLYSYYKHSKSDTAFVKTLVYGCVLFQIAVTALDSFISYRQLVRDWGRVDALLSTDIPLVLTAGLPPLESAIPGFIVQCFFTWRIWGFSNALTDQTLRIFIKCLSAFVLLVGLTSFGSSVGLTYGLFRSQNEVALFQWVFIALQLWTFSTAAADITITICMMVILYHAKSAAQFRETRFVISKIIRIVLQTGLLTSVLALLVPILGYTLHFGFYALPWFLLGKSYVISLPANLNARPRRKEITTYTSGDAATGGPSHLTTMAFTSTRQSNPREHPNLSSHGFPAFLRSLPMVNHRDSDTSPLAAVLESQSGHDIGATLAAETYSPDSHNEK